MLDMGPYYITDLVNLLGPVARVAGIASRARAERDDHQRAAARARSIPVEVATHVAGTLEFASGAVVPIAMSFDVPRHATGRSSSTAPKAALIVPDPNRFGGEIEIAHARPGLDGAADRASLCRRQLPDHRRRRHGARHPLRTARTAPRGELALHVLEVMEAFQTLVRQRPHVTIATRPERPAMLPTELQFGDRCD